jgi:hypothetical protein
MPRRRKNAQFARKLLPQTIDDVFAEFGIVDAATQVQANRWPVDVFYKNLNDLYPDYAIIYIPPPEAIRPKLSVYQQVFVFADYSVRKIAPIALDAVGLKAEAAKLRKLPKIVDKDTSFAAADAARDAQNAGDAAFHAAYDARRVAANANAARAADATGVHISADNAAGGAAYAAYYAAKLNPEATWDAVTEMLYTL